ncbi:MAG: leucine-rich repeat domain-containing protein, partial [Candidatus Odinarchaeota archaeon]
MDIVKYKKDNFEVKDGVLSLNDKGINSIDNIEGLQYIQNLLMIYLWKNKITEIKGLGKFKELITLDLHNNQISTISGLKNLVNLKI